MGFNSGFKGLILLFDHKKYKLDHLNCVCWFFSPNQPVDTVSTQRFSRNMHILMPSENVHYLDIKKTIDFDL